ncbi:MAG: hypothetical protein ACREKL_08575, partial [Chthoniobacterales bacterium]
MTNKLFRPATYRFLLSLVVVSALCVTVTSTAHAGLFALNSTSGTIGSYAFDGTTVQNPLVNTGLDFAQGLAIWNNTLFVADSGTGDVLAYDATTGAPAGGFTTITGLTSTSALAVSGNSLYVLSFDSLD